MRTKKAELFTAFILLLLGLVAILSSSFAWLNVSRVPFISDLEISVITDNGLLIAPDVDGKPGEWHNYLDASEFLKDMAPLYPVSYQNGGFYKLAYDESGRADVLVPINEKTDITYAMDLTDRKEIVPDEETISIGHMIALDFWFKCEGGGAKVFLADPTTNSDGQLQGGTYAVGAPIWSDKEVRHLNGGYGSETTLRLGFDIQHASADAVLSGPKSFFIYEPNADIHNDPEIKGYVETSDVSGQPIIDNAHHIIQNASRWNEVNPVLADVVVYDPGRITKNADLFTIKQNELIKCRLYFWMEGQDIDCLARTVSDSVAIASNLQFGVTEDDSSREIVVVRK